MAFLVANIQWAKLQFNAKAARWIRAEIWHPDQKQTNLADGALMLEVPYSDETEMVMDILRHGSNVKVIAPESLVNSLVLALKLALVEYVKV